MKRILLAMCILAASWQAAMAQFANQTVKKAEFVSMVTLLDTQIGAGDLKNANISFDDIQKMMRTVLHDNKMGYAATTSETEKKAYTDVSLTQGALFNQIWKMRTDFTTNRTAIHGKLVEFENTLK